MGVHMPNLPDADQGIPKGWVAPDYFRDPEDRAAAHVSARNRNPVNDIERSACSPENRLQTHTHTIV